MSQIIDFQLYALAAQAILLASLIIAEILITAATNGGGGIARRIFLIAHVITHVRVKRDSVLVIARLCKCPL